MLRAAPFHVQACVVGAGVVGLATARQLAKRGLDVLVLEAAETFGTGTSSRNSEVVHAGIYYPHSSVKAMACVEGRRALYRFADEYGVPYKRCGKLIVATTLTELDMLADIQQKACHNGVSGQDEALRSLSLEEAREREPEVSCVGALLSPATGVVDSHAFMLALLGSAEHYGAGVSYRSRVVGGAVLPSGRLLLQTQDETELECDILINTGGHCAPAIASAIGSIPEGLVPQPRYAKGNYFGLLGPSPFRGLVYPVPQQAGLGVHATVDLAGRCRFGPDVQWVDPAEVHAYTHSSTCIVRVCIYGSIQRRCDSQLRRSLLATHHRHTHTSPHTSPHPPPSLSSQPSCWRLLFVQDGLLDHTVDPARAEAFYSEVRKYWPGLADGALVPDYAGIRPKIQAPLEPARDFVLLGPRDHGVNGLVHMFGIESPGLTASLSLARIAVEMLDGARNKPCNNAQRYT